MEWVMHLEMCEPVLGDVIEKGGWQRAGSGLSPSASSFWITEVGHLIKSHAKVYINI